MNLLELISHYRDRADDHETPDTLIVARLIRADLEVFSAHGGHKDGLIHQALETTVEETVSASRPTIVLPSIPSETRVYINGGLCQMVTPSAAATLDSMPGSTPAASVQGSTITLYPYTWGETVTAKVVYLRPPAPMLYLMGLETVNVPSGYGRSKDRAGLAQYRITFPSSGWHYAANALRGGILSIQVNDTWREDYLIEENEAGALTRVYVQENPIARVDRPVTIFDGPADLSSKSFPAMIHKGSELPEQYHHEIIAAAIPQMAVK